DLSLGNDRMGRIRDHPSHCCRVDLAGCRQTQKGNNPPSISNGLQNSFPHCLSFRKLSSLSRRIVMSALRFELTPSTPAWVRFQSLFALSLAAPSAAVSCLTE